MTDATCAAIGRMGLSFEFTESANSFNGEPQAQAKYGNDACGLPLNDENHSAHAAM